jgi:hypothetical protein
MIEGTRELNAHGTGLENRVKPSSILSTFDPCPSFSIVLGANDGVVQVLHASLDLVQPACCVWRACGLARIATCDDKRIEDLAIFLNRCR